MRQYFKIQFILFRRDIKVYSKIENTSIEKINQAHSHQKKLSALSLTEKKKKKI